MRSGSVWLLLLTACKEEQPSCLSVCNETVSLCNAGCESWPDCVSSMDECSNAYAREEPEFDPDDPASYSDCWYALDDAMEANSNAYAAYGEYHDSTGRCP